MRSIGKPTKFLYDKTYSYPPLKDDVSKYGFTGQRQLTFPFAINDDKSLKGMQLDNRHGYLSILRRCGSGKTSLLRLVLLYLFSHYCPDDVDFFIYSSAFMSVSGKGMR